MLTSFLGLPLRFPPPDGAAAVFCKKKQNKVKETLTDDHLFVILKKTIIEVQGAIPVSVCRWQQHDFNER